MEQTVDRLLGRILVATDGSPDAASALRAAVDLSNKIGSELHLVHVWRAVPRYSHPSVAVASDSGLYEREAREILFGQLDEVGAAEGVAAAAHLRRGRPADEIVGLADELRAGLVVLGSRGLGPVKRFVMGSVSEGVLGLARCPVLVARGGERAWPPARVVVGDDGSGGARSAARLGSGIGKVFGAQVALLRARPVVVPMAEAPRLSRTLPGAPELARIHHGLALSELAWSLEREVGHRPRIHLADGEASLAILEAADQGPKPALIAVGRRGLGGLDRLRLGSVSTRTLRAATCPVLVCPP